MCSTNHELKCEPVIENKCTNGGSEAYCKVVNGTTCSTVHDEVCEDVVSKECHDIYEQKCTKVQKEVCKVSASGLVSINMKNAEGNCLGTTMRTSLQHWRIFCQKNLFFPQPVEKL